MLYRKILRPLLFRLPPETVHELAIKSLTNRIAPGLIRKLVSRRSASPQFGNLSRFDISFPNPIGIAAGFDKNGVVVDSLAALGFGFVEVGTVTHIPQPGNPCPRLFRLPLDKALINRLGFNNHGAAALAERFSARPPQCVIGINIGKSRVVRIEESTADYLASFSLVYPFADFIVINVSSPNTPNLRELQSAGALESLLMALQERNRELSGTSKRSGLMPLLVKIAPDLDDRAIEAIVEVSFLTNLAGIVATNTTTNRLGLQTPSTTVATIGEGGLSGAPLRSRSNNVISKIYRLSKGRIPIIGVGGVFTAEDAWAKISSGASLVQLYTGLVYEGWSIVGDINHGLEAILHREGIKSLDVAVGVNCQ